MHFLDGTEPGASGVLELAQRALELSAGAAPRRTPGKRLATVFLNPSLRTRASMEAAAGALGAQTLVIAPSVIGSESTPSSTSLLKNGTTDPREPTTLPYLTTENRVRCPPAMLFAATNSLSDASLVAPYAPIPL